MFFYGNSLCGLLGFDFHFIIETVMKMVCPYTKFIVLFDVLSIVVIVVIVIIGVFGLLCVFSLMLTVNGLKTVPVMVHETYLW